MPRDHPDWAQLLMDAVSKPGIISTAYSRFWNYSTGNQLLALFQCFERKLEPGPINTFLGWRELGRHVRKGEKALTLCMPVIVKLKPKEGESAEGDKAKVPTARRFVYRANWFLLSQTEGAEYVPTTLPQWNEATALASLGIERIAFDHLNGNVQGFAAERRIAVSPIAALPHKTLLHELAHVVLGHCGDATSDRSAKALREVEAECVALVCCESLNLPGSDECRGYIQHWLGTETIPDRCAQRIFKAADQILKAGQVKATVSEFLFPL